MRAAAAPPPTTRCRPSSCGEPRHPRPPRAESAWSAMPPEAGCASWGPTLPLAFTLPRTRTRTEPESWP
eukprot:scaffold1203_cov74-Phaeocystis_antarctica.AAC.9